MADRKLHHNVRQGVSVGILKFRPYVLSSAHRECNLVLPSSEKATAIALSGDGRRIVVGTTTGFNAYKYNSYHDDDTELQCPGTIWERLTGDTAGAVLTAAVGEDEDGCLYVFLSRTTSPRKFETERHRNP